MAEMLQRRWILKRYTRQSERADAQASKFTTIQTFSPLELALFLFAIEQGLLGDAGYLTRLFLQL
jgi:hypothetical protein